MTPESLARLHARCFTSPPPWSSAAFAALMADRQVFLLLEGEAGFLLGRAVAGEAELLTLAVAPQARRQGLGRRLVGRFLDQGRRRGACTALLEVSVDNRPAQALYRAAGFAEVGRRPGYCRSGTGAPLDALILRRALTEAAAADPT